MQNLDWFFLKLQQFTHVRLYEHDSVIIFDEVEYFPRARQVIKYLVADGRYKYLETGSYLERKKNLQNILIPSEELKLTLIPLDFEEFLYANGFNEIAINSIHAKFIKKESLESTIHNRLLDLFKKYLLTGGLPDAINSFINDRNIFNIRKIQSDIYDYYGDGASKYDKDHKLKIKRIYDLIPSNLEDKKKRVVVKNIENIKGKRFSNYQDEFDFLINSGIALEVKAISTPVFPLIESSGKNLLKLYLNDAGLLSNIFI